MIAVITLILLTILTAGAVVQMMGSKAPSSPISAVLRVEEKENKLVITHLSGDKIGYAFKLNDGAVLWLNLVVRKNGENLNITGGARVGELTDGVINFGTGSKLELPVGVESGDEVSVVYVPTGQVLVDEKF